MNNMIYNVRFPKLGFDFEVNPIALKIGTLTVRWYGLILGFGFMLAYIYINKRSWEFKIDKNKFTDVIITGLIFGIIGARLYYVIFYPGDYYKENPLKILSISEGGIAIYGGIIGGMISGVIMCLIKRVNIFSALDLSSLGFLIGQSIGRWGNFVNQEAFGSETSLPWGMSSQATYNKAVHPCFLYESLWCLSGFILLHIYSKNKSRYNGEVFLLYIMWYSLGRIFIEGLRTDSLYIPIINLKVSQVLSIVLFFSSFFYYIGFKVLKKSKK